MGRGRRNSVTQRGKEAPSGGRVKPPPSGLRAQIVVIDAPCDGIATNKRSSNPSERPRGS